MRAKVRVSHVTNHGTQEEVVFHPVCKPGSYPSDGSDEDNTFAKFSPSGEFRLTIANPALLDTYKPGQMFYVDFTPVPPKPAAEAQ